jgi:hypothetical protein
MLVNINQVMRRKQIKSRLKLWLLTFALAIVLTWYVINPDPGPLHPREREDDASNAELRRIRAEAGGTSLQHRMRPAFIPGADEDLPEWPEYIEID